MNLPKTEIWLVGGSMSPITTSDKFNSGIDGYNLYFKIGNQTYRITNKELEQYKVETNKQ